MKSPLLVPIFDGYIYILFAPLYPHFTTKLVDYLNIQFTKNYANEIMIPMI